MFHQHYLLFKIYVSSTYICLYKMATPDGKRIVEILSGSKIPCIAINTDGCPPEMFTVSVPGFSNVTTSCMTWREYQQVSDGLRWIPLCPRYK